MWTCVSTRPGDTTRSAALNTFAPVGSSLAYSTMRSMTPFSMCSEAGRSPSGRITRLLRTTNTDSTAASASRRALKKRPAAGAADERAVFDHEAAARQHGVGRARHLASLVRVVVHVHVKRLR